MVTNEDIARRLDLFVAERERRGLNVNVSLRRSASFIRSLSYSLGDFYTAHGKSLPIDLERVAGPFWQDVDFYVTHDSNATQVPTGYRPVRGRPNNNTGVNNPHYLETQGTLMEQPGRPTEEED